MDSLHQTILNEDRVTAGTWRLFDTGDTLVTVKQPLGIIIVALGGIWLSWAIRYLSKILGNIALFFHSCRYIGWRATLRNENIAEILTTESSVLILTDRNGGQHLAQALKEKHGMRDLMKELRSNKSLNTEERIWLFLLILLVGGAASSMLLGGYRLATMKLDWPARLASEQCGLWVFDGERRSGAATRASLMDLEKEERAASFAANCYMDHRNALFPPCNRLYLPSLPVSKATYTNDCPFRNEICRYNQSVSFDTGIIDSKLLGINSPKTPKFRHKTTCTPLSMEYPYVQNVTDNGTKSYYYYYGEKPGADTPTNYTYKTVGNPWDRLAPVYDLFVYSASADESSDAVWLPRAELKHSSYSTLTIIFISSLRILYKERSDDAIFPADLPWSIPGDPRPWFRNSDPRARPLACINTIEVCTADEIPTCWNIESPNDPNVDDGSPEYTLLYASLYKANIYDSIAKRQGRGLLAQQLVSQYFSEGLGGDAWVTEVQNMVFTALARAQINAWSVAAGEDSIHEGHDGYIQLTQGYGDLCGRFIYNPQSYHTLLFYPLVVVACTLPGLWILTLDWNPIEQTIWDTLRTMRHFPESALSGFIASLASSRQKFAEARLTQDVAEPTAGDVMPVEEETFAERQESREAMLTPDAVEPTTDDVMPIEEETSAETDGSAGICQPPASPRSTIANSSNNVVQNYGTFTTGSGSATGDETTNGQINRRPRVHSERSRASSRSSGPTQRYINWEPLLWLGILRLLWRIISWFKDWILPHNDVDSNNSP